MPNSAQATYPIEVWRLTYTNETYTRIYWSNIEALEQLTGKHVIIIKIQDTSYS